MKYSKYIVFCFLIIVYGCSKNSNPSTGILPESTFVAYFADSLVLGEYQKISGFDSTEWKHKIDSLREHYQCKIELLEATHQHYRKNLTLWDSLFTMVNCRLELHQQKELQKNQNINKKE
ncbi:MAG: hypothetical protein HZB59_04845 [Ignavibacteriales bacterium]|nr:hypothetical protein [Ignavibacteriales bacterium]